jgi:hypothetical protein
MNTKNTPTLPSDIFQQNLSTLMQNNSHYNDFLFKDVSTPGALSIINDNGRPNLLLNNDELENKSLLHDIETVDHAVHEIIKSGQINENELVFWVGAGLGYEVLTLRKIMPEIRLVLIEPDIALFKLAMENVDLRPLFTLNTGCYLGDKANIASILKGEDEAMRALPMQIIGQHKIMELFDETFSLYSKIEREIFQFKNGLDTIEAMGEVNFLNTVRNVNNLTNSVSIDSLKGKFKGCPAVCVAAGGSLTKNAGLLKNYKNKILIIAVDSAVKVLLNHGVEPHIIVSIDAHQGSYAKLESVFEEIQNIPLVWGAEIYPETLDSYLSRKKFIAPAVNDLFKFYFADLIDPYTPPDAVSAAIFTALHTALTAEVSCLLMMGFDLAFASDKSHAEGCPITWKSEKYRNDLFLIDGWYDKPVSTHSVLCCQLFQFEQLISRIPMKVIDATEGGALKAGTERLELEKALEQYCQRSFALEKIISEIWDGGKKTSLDSVIKKLANLVDEIIKSKNLCRAGSNHGKAARKLLISTRKGMDETVYLKKINKKISFYADAINTFMANDKLIRAMFPIRVKEHNRLTYAHYRLNKERKNLSPRQQILKEIDINLDYCKSWIKSADLALKIIRPVITSLERIAKKE